MVLTVWVAQFNLPKIGPFSGTVVNQMVALVIALVKAWLVVTIFMGVKFGTKLIKLWAAVGFIWVTLIFGILGDYTMRHYEPAIGWDGKAESALPRVTPEEPTIPSANDLNVKIRQ
jgi:caa(3)-type oxidase subunit IV